MRRRTVLFSLVAAAAGAGGPAACSATSAGFEAITRTSTEFWRWSLYGDPAARSRIPEAAATGGVAALEDQL